MEKLIRSLETFISDMEDRMQKEVSEHLNKPMPVLTEEKFALFEKNGNRSIYEKDYFERRRFLALFGVAALRMKEDRLEQLGTVKKEDICKKLEEILLDICQEECWAVPAHVNRSNGSDWRNTIDLFGSETADAVAYISDKLSDWLNEECCNTVRENVKRRVVDPFFLSETGRWHWEQSHHNWNSVCNGCVASAYLHTLSGGEEGKCAYIERICDNLQYFIDGYADDGTCMEGLAYFDYGMTYFTNFAMELYDISEGRIDLLCGDWGEFKKGEKDKRAKIATWWCNCFFRSGRTVSFSDGSSRGKYRVGVASALALRFPEIKLPDFKMAGSFEEDHCARFTPYKMDYFFSRRYLAYLKEHMADVNNESEISEKNEEGKFLVLDSAQWCIGSAKNGVGMACKGGHNKEPHNHNDIASFLYVVGEDMLLEDLGAGEYTKEYFGPNRYNVFCNTSFSHNVPIIGGQGQQSGREYQADLFNAKDKDEKGIIEIHAASAYEKDLIHRFERHMTFDKNNGLLEIEEVFDNQGKEIRITENLVSRFVPEIRDNGVVLDGMSGSCKISACVLDGETKSFPVFQVKEQSHSNHDGTKDQVYQIQWDVLVKKETKVHIIIEPKVK